MGIDEAGRGCVIGPLVMAGFLIPEDDEALDRLGSLGVKDSKLLVSGRRDELSVLIKKFAYGYSIIKIEALKLDSRSINELEIEHSSKIIDALKPKRVYLDVPSSGRGIENYCNAVKSRCACGDVEVFGGNKMDRNNLLVASASILAKSERERQIRALKEKYGDFGSGYASDIKTIRWLKKWRARNRRWPSIVRTKWSTLLRI